MAKILNLRCFSDNKLYFSQFTLVNSKVAEYFCESCRFSIQRLSNCVVRPSSRGNIIYLESVDRGMLEKFTVLLRNTIISSPDNNY